ncbi:alpha/beta fold hydrolase [Microbacterium sp.]|uniref:alpha/beta fold hydrolase n=1 Tax=Microbacterium sp. TaxID=51671 RepID=UPI00342DC4D1
MSEDELAGHSYGGLISRLLASVHPNDVAGLVLVDALTSSSATRSLSSTRFVTGCRG